MRLLHAAIEAIYHLTQVTWRSEQFALESPMQCCTLSHCEDNVRSAAKPPDLESENSVEGCKEGVKERQPCSACKDINWGDGIFGANRVQDLSLYIW